MPRRTIVLGESSSGSSSSSEDDVCFSHEGDGSVEKAPLKEDDNDFSDASSVEIPYTQAMDENANDCCDSEVQKEPLRPGDVIRYTDPMAVAGSWASRRTALVIATRPDCEFRLTLANRDYLPPDTYVTRIYEYRDATWYPHPGIARYITDFRMRKREPPTKALIQAFDEKVRPLLAAQQNKLTPKSKPIPDNDDDDDESDESSVLTSRQALHERLREKYKLPEPTQSQARPSRYNNDTTSSSSSDDDSSVEPVPKKKNPVSNNKSKSLSKPTTASGLWLSTSTPPTTKPRRVVRKKPVAKSTLLSRFGGSSSSDASSDDEVLFSATKQKTKEKDNGKNSTSKTTIGKSVGLSSSDDSSDVQLRSNTTTNKNKKGRTGKNGASTSQTNRLSLSKRNSASSKVVNKWSQALLSSSQRSREQPTKSSSAIEIDSDDNDSLSFTPHRAFAKKDPNESLDFMSGSSDDSFCLKSRPRKPKRKSLFQAQVQEFQSLKRKAPPLTGRKKNLPLSNKVGRRKRLASSFRPSAVEATPPDDIFAFSQESEDKQPARFQSVVARGGSRRF